MPGVLEGLTHARTRLQQGVSYVEMWAAWLVAAGRPESTVTLRQYQLRRYLDDHPDPWAVDAQQLAEWLAGQSWSPETRRSWRSALRTFYAWAIQRGLTTSSPAHELPPVVVPAAIARPAPDAVVHAALETPDLRTRLMANLAARSGMRRAEIAHVHEHDLHRDLVGWSLLVHGKGGRQRMVPVHDDLAFMIRRRLDEGGGWLFPGRMDGHLAPRRVGELVGMVLPDPWTTHTLRHWFATKTWEATRDIYVVMRLLGHTKPETTARYIATSTAALRDAVAWAG